MAFFLLLMLRICIEKCLEMHFKISKGRAVKRGFSGHNILANRFFRVNSNSDTAVDSNFDFKTYSFFMAIESTEVNECQYKGSRWSCSEK